MRVVPFIQMVGAKGNRVVVATSEIIGIIEIVGADDRRSHIKLRNGDEIFVKDDIDAIGRAMIQP